MFLVWLGNDLIFSTFDRLCRNLMAMALLDLGNICENKTLASKLILIPSKAGICWLLIVFTLPETYA